MRISDLKQLSHVRFTKGAVFVSVFVVLAIALGGLSLFRHKPTFVKVVQGKSLASIPIPLRVGIQVGHWKNEELPAELHSIYWNFGASANGYNEVDINLAVAQMVGALLEKQGIVVDILPSTVPHSYKADAFIAIHSDGNDDKTISGYKVAPSAWDVNGKATLLASTIATSYGNDTHMTLGSSQSINESMTQYYAFNSAKYTHAIDLLTPGVIIELGYITNAQDRQMITKSDDLVAQGVTDGILKYLGK
jgi:hypothetical protein